MIPMPMLLRSSVLLSLVGATLLRADEGMWTFDNLPVQQIQERYGFSPSQAWLDHVRMASVRFNDGGSGSFISSTGLVLTNHHVARGQLQKVSTPQKNYVRDGFLARSGVEELPCPDLELNVLASLEDVTARVRAAVPTGMNDKEALQARKAAIARLEKESLDATGLRSDVVSLYQGGEYWLYRYQKYTDVRLVFAPEQQIAFYGGDPDNFTFPRHDLDMAIFRVYEHGQPVQNHEYLKWNPQGAATGELVFVSGHPGSTNRLNTLAQLEYLRDQGLPANIKSLRRRLGVIKQYADRGPEEARQASSSIFGLENSLKAQLGQYEGLKSPALLAKKAQDEAAFRKRVASNPEWQKAYGQAWDELAAVEKKALDQRGQSSRRIGGLRLPGLVLNLLRYGSEVARPDGQRLSEFHEAGLESLRFRLLSPAPVYPALEEALLADSLKQSLEELGPKDPFIRLALGDKSPEAQAHALISGTRLADPALRKQLLEGGAAAVAASQDPLLTWARGLDPLLREQHRWQEEQLQSVREAASEKIGKARFAAYGKAVNPDATFTLRLAFGTVKGYPCNGTQAPPKTTFHGLYDRAASFDFGGAFALPARYLERKDKLELNTPLDFVSTCDIIGGNSGSPVLNRAGDLVGLVFDGNIESLVGRFVFDDTSNRAVAVHTAAMTEALIKLYDAEFLLKEITGK